MSTTLGVTELESLSDAHTPLRFYRPLAVALFFCTAPVLADANYSIFLTSQARDGVPLAEPATEFGCSDRIYAVVTAKGLSKTQHELEAVWRDPHGKERERTRYPFLVRYDEERLWVWLKLHRSPDAALVQFMNPSAGMDEFVGDWNIKFFVDGKLVDQRDFRVIC